MNITYGEIVSRIMNTLNSVSKDAYISKAYIVQVLRRQAEFFIAQKITEGNMYLDDSIYTYIDCFPLEEIDTVKCDIVEFRLAKSVMKSVYKLPNLIKLKNNKLIKDVLSIDDMTEFKTTTPSQYRRDKNRKSMYSDYSYYYVKNNDLYLLDTRTKRVNLAIATLEEEKIKDCYYKDDCDCKSIWEYEFKCPKDLLNVVISETIKEITFKKQIRKDENPNLNENEV